MHDMKPLADQLQAEIRKQADTRVEDAMTSARDGVIRLYEQHLKPLAGHALGPMLAEALHQAERQVAARAKQIIEAREVADVTRRLTGVVLKLVEG